MRGLSGDWANDGQSLEQAHGANRARMQISRRRPFFV